MKIKKSGRPPFFSALCVLTFIGSGVAFIGYFLASLFFEKTSELIITYSSWDSVDRISPPYFTFLMILYGFSLVGAIRMWKFHKDGFFIYTIAQLIILFLPSLWIGWMAFSTTNVVFTAVFVVGYFLNFKVLRK
jgi:hypothetical protein